MADNSANKFKFISPGVFVQEIDNSQLPADPGAVGPLVIGRSRKGPANKPVRIESFSDFVDTFGEAVAGRTGGDTWRNGDLSAPTYGAYAAQAWLSNNSPCTFLRVLGDQKTGVADAGKAGWELDPTDGTALAQGGVYALVVWPSSSNITVASAVTGTIAAQFYCQDSRVLLSGTLISGSQHGGVASMSGSTVYELGANLDNIRLVFTGSSLSASALVSMDSSKPNYIRRVLNTDPTVTNGNITSGDTQTYFQGGKYFLGETFENRLSTAGSSSIGVLSTAEAYWGAIMPMLQRENATTFSTDQANFRGPAKKASTGFFFSQDLSSDNTVYSPKSMQKLFRLEALTAGENFNRDIKISIANLKAGEGDFEEYGTFSVFVRNARDTDAVQEIIERYDNLNLNPASRNYIAARIGDKYEEYSQVEKRNVQYGEFDNNSNYIRVVMDDDIAAGVGEPRLLPFGVYGPPRYRSVAVASGSFDFSNFGDGHAQTPKTNTTNDVRTQFCGASSASLGMAGFGARFPNATVVASPASGVLNVGDVGTILGIDVPGVPLRKDSTQGNPRKLSQCFWGAWTGRSYSDTNYNYEMPDYLRPRNSEVDADGTSVFSTTLDINGETAQSGSSPLVISWAFSLDDISGSLDASNDISGSVYYISGSRAGSTSMTAGGTSYVTLLKAGIDRFTTTLAGGSDGYNKVEREPFSNTNALDGKTDDNSYSLFSLRKAINIVSDAEDVEMNVVTIPGVWAAEVTDDLLAVAEDRGDTLALVDLQYGYTPRSETTSSPKEANAANTPKAAAETLLGRNINNSYGAAYYPWVRIYDTNAAQNVWVPPSVAALGVLSTTDSLQAPWFAPAGFTRGGLSEGAAGLPVLDVSQRLTSDQRDLLYEANINPIAKFPAEGIVVFGQKTLQQTASALDRINVRRLMIFLKREISFIASRLLFGPNAQATWDRFTGQARPLLDAVQAEFGIEDFRLILDETTTTPDLIDRNIIYAKLLVKPTRAVEYFAIDFVVTNSGAAFED
jgi:hypothetical protein